ncbi:MAG: ATP-binding protein [candidate division SR1 bacterium]|nr:ATP-binding protein [candidate division SR1 bacterium]
MVNTPQNDNIHDSDNKNNSSVQEIQRLLERDQADIQRKTIALAELHGHLGKYSSFFKENEREMETLINDEIQMRELDNFVSGSFESLESFVSFSQLVLSNLRKINKIYSFLRENKRGREMLSLIMKMADAETSNASDTLFILERDINNLRDMIGGLFENIITMVNSSGKLEQIASSIEEDIKKSYVGEYANPFFGKVATGNVNQKHKGNFLLTHLYNDIFDKIPVKEKKEDTPGVQNKIELLASDIAQIKNSGIYSDIVSGKMFGTLPYQVFKRLFKLYEQLLHVHREVELGMEQVLSKRDPRLLEQRFRSGPSQIEEKYDSLTEWFGQKNRLLHTQIDSIYNGFSLDLTGTKTQVGQMKLVNLKVAIFKILDTYFDDKDGKLNVSSLIQTKTDFEKNKKALGKTVEEGGKSTNHYVYATGDHGLISGYESHTLKKPAKVIGKTAETITKKIDMIIERKNTYNNIYSSFPGIDNSLEGNILLMGPYGYGKTALIRELGSNTNIVTLQANYADIATAYYGHEEKNATAIFNYAQQLGEEKNKEVFVLIDEMDKFFAAHQTSRQATNLGVQTAFQVGMDGIDAYDKVHIVGLTNKPQFIPMDIMRRMTLLMMDPLSLAEKAELIHSRLNRFPKSDDLEQFLGEIKSSSYKDNELANKIEIATPKIIAGITEKAFLLFHDKILKQDKTTIIGIDKKIGKIMKKKSPDDKKIKEIYAATQLEITLQNFSQAIEEVFTSKSTAREIEVSKDFYNQAEALIKNIQSTSYTTE